MQILLQWNCRGIRTGASDLQVTVGQHIPLAVCLQETKLSPESVFAIRGYSVFRKDLAVSTIAHGGVAVAVHHSVPVQHIPLRSPLQAVAVRLHLMRRELTLCSIYLPPGLALPSLELRRLMLELPSPVLLLGDFNAHNSAWGCENTDTRGRLLEAFIHEESLCVLNTGTNTISLFPRANLCTRPEYCQSAANAALYMVCPWWFSWQRPLSGMVELPWRTSDGWQAS